MRESEFIRQNHKDWNDSKESSPEKLSDLYIKITSDLSYSKTHYPHRSITRDLNERATLMHSSIYKNERPTFNAFLDYWKRHLPLTLYANRRALYLAFSIFVTPVFANKYPSPAIIAAVALDIFKKSLLLVFIMAPPYLLIGKFISLPHSSQLPV